MVDDIYVLAGLGVIVALIVVKEIHRKFISSGTSNKYESDSSRGLSLRRGKNGNADDDSDGSIGNSEDDDSGPGGHQTDQDDSRKGGKEGSQKLTDRLPFIGDDEEEGPLSIYDDPVVGEERLRITEEFDEVVADEVTEAIVDPQKDLETIVDPSPENALPPHLEGGDIDPEEFLSRVDALHQRQIAAPSVKVSDTEMKIGDTWRRVLFAHMMPDVTPLGGLKQIIDDPTLHFDLNIHFHALDRDKTLRKVKRLHDNLNASVGISDDHLAAGDKEIRRQKAKEFRDEIKQGEQRPLLMSIYVSLQDTDRERLRERVDEIREEFKTTADIRLKTLERNQKEGVIAASPIGVDEVHREVPDIDPTHVGLGQSFGALIASLTQSRKFEPTGHEWGIHSVQGHPIVKDPFQSPRNYNMVVVGESGSGKSVNTKAMALSTKAVRKDTLIIMLDPLQGFVGLAEALDATKVTIGGKQNLNPMEIRKPPDDHIESEAFDDDKDPLSAKVDDVMAFIQNYVGQQPGLTFGDESQLLRSLILEAYNRNGITRDVYTHDKESPTLTDVLELAQEAKEEPKRWARGPQNPAEIKEQAAQIGNILREFSEGGQYEHLSKQSEEDPFGDSDVIYLDLSQQEASGGGGTGVMGQLMFSLAYEKCKQYPGPAIYIIDEARFLFREAETLEYLAQRVRHSRHYNTSIRFITQEMDDFFEFPQAEGIVNNSSFKVIHQAPDVETWGDRFDLKQLHMDYVKNAATGTEHPFSQALVQFPEKDQWYPIDIRLGENMLAIADFDEQEDSKSDLPGRGEDLIQRSPIVRELVARIRTGETSQTKALDELLEDWEKPYWEMLTPDRAQIALSRIAEGTHPREAIYTQALEQIRWAIDRAGGDDIANEMVERHKSIIEQRYAESYTDLDQEEIDELIGQTDAGTNVSTEDQDAQTILEEEDSTLTVTDGGGD